MGWAVGGGGAEEAPPSVQALVPTPAWALPGPALAPVLRQPALYCCCGLLVVQGHILKADKTTNQFGHQLFKLDIQEPEGTK